MNQFDREYINRLLGDFLPTTRDNDCDEFNSFEVFCEAHIRYRHGELVVLLVNIGLIREGRAGE